MKIPRGKVKLKRKPADRMLNLDQRFALRQTRFMGLRRSPANANDKSLLPHFLISCDKYSLDLQMRRRAAASSLTSIHKFFKIICHNPSFSLALKLGLSGALNHVARANYVIHTFLYVS